jgi:hypothetical protein
LAFQSVNISSPKSQKQPKPSYSKSYQIMEEEDLSFSNPFFLQSANNPTPKQQKQTKPSTSKCNCPPSSSITQQKNPHPYPLKTSKSQTNPPPTYAQNSSTSTLTQIA